MSRSYVVLALLLSAGCTSSALALLLSAGCAAAGAPAPRGALSATTPRPPGQTASAPAREVRWTPDERGLIVDGAMIVALDGAGKPSAPWRLSAADQRAVRHIEPEAISPDGKQLVALDEATVRIWTPHTTAARTIAAPPITAQAQQRCVAGWRDAARPMIACANQETGDHTCAAHDGKGWQATPCPAAEFVTITGWRHASATGGALLVGSGGEGAAAWSVDDPALKGGPPGAGYPALVVWPEGGMRATLTPKGELVWTSDCDWSQQPHPCQLDDDARRWQLWRASAGSAPLPEQDVPEGADVAPGRGALVWARGQTVCVAPVKRWSAPEAQRCFDLPTRTP